MYGWSEGGMEGGREGGRESGMVGGRELPNEGGGGKEGGRAGIILCDVSYGVGAYGMKWVHFFFI